MSFTHARDDIGVLYVRGTDATGFVDGLSTNLIPTEPGRAVQTAFTDRAAKIIAAAVVLVREEGVVLLVHRPVMQTLIEHLQPRRLGQDVALVDLSERNHVVYGIGLTSTLDVGTWQTQEAVTTVQLHQELQVHVIAGAPLDDEPSNVEAWTAWRIQHRWPEHGVEITAKHHPYACGLEDLVHDNKGCYLGQEVLTRMKSRGKTGWILMQGVVTDFPEQRLTTTHEGKALAIVRTGEVQ